MSRGLGRVERAVLDQLEDGRWHSVHDLATAMFGPFTDKSRKVSVRRAVRRLEASGLVEIAPAIVRTTRTDVLREDTISMRTPGIAVRAWVGPLRPRPALPPSMWRDAPRGPDDH
jgi:hypothetical protein